MSLLRNLATAMRQMPGVGQAWVMRELGEVRRGFDDGQAGEQVIQSVVGARWDDVSIVCLEVVRRWIWWNQVDVMWMLCGVSTEFCGGY